MVITTKHFEVIFLLLASHVLLVGEKSYFHYFASFIGQNKDPRQQIYSIHQQPSPVLIRSASSYSSNHSKRKEMHMLSISPDNRKERQRLKPPIYAETISITETTSSEHLEIDVGAPPPTDESFFFENLESLRDVEVDGINILEKVWQTVSVAEMKVLTEMENGNVPERDGILFPDFDNKFRSTAFAWASFRGLSHLLPKLEASGADINSIQFGYVTSVMCAAFSGEIACLKYLIKRGANLDYVVPRFGHCALHSAAAGHCPETAEILLDSGGDLNNASKNPDMIPLLHYAIGIKSEAVAELFLKRGADPTYKNLNGETPLHVACNVQSLKCCELLLQKPEVNVNALDEINRTPLHHAIMATDSNIKIVELLLKHGALVNSIDKKGFSPLHVAALEEHSECVEMLIRNGADVSATTSKGVSALNIILRKIPESFQAFRNKMDSSITLSRPGFQNREYEMRFDFSLLLPSEEKPETSFIHSFIQENMTHILSHPLVTSFLYLKWQRIKKFYIFNICLYTLMVLSMSTYVLTALGYECYNSVKENISSINATNVICYYFDKRVVELNWYIWLAFVCWMIPRKILSFTTYNNFEEYLWNIDNAMDTIIIISIFATSFVYTGRTYNWQKYMGAFSVLCAWTNLMFMLGQLPGFGTYVVMFTHIQLEFAKLLFVYSGPLIGFTLSFCIIFDEEPSFANVLTGLIKVLSMMVGELDFDQIMNHRDRSESGYTFVYDLLSFCSQILFSLFVIFIVFILMNLLVGIAVHDIRGLRNQAGLAKIIRATKLIVYMEKTECKMKLSSFLSKFIFNKEDDQLRKRILVVKPLNPLEKRLPTAILNVAYQIAKKNSPTLDNEHSDFIGLVSYNRKMEEGYKENTLETAVEKLALQFKINTDEVHEVKDQLREMKKFLEEIISKLS